MLKIFTSQEDLLSYMQKEKEEGGGGSIAGNRYPIRFIMFESFEDLKNFSESQTDSFSYSIDDLVSAKEPDIFPTDKELTNAITEKCIKVIRSRDCVIYSFSELTRFYEQAVITSLLTTICGTESPQDAQAKHTRIYIPIIGMEERFGKLIDDPYQSLIWAYKPRATSGAVYNLVLVKSTTYGIKALPSNYTIVSNLREWLNLWKKGSEVGNNIISTSENLFVNSKNIQPDNVFCYKRCSNAFEFLKGGLKIDLGGVPYNEKDAIMWEKLASYVDTEKFNLRDFVYEHFNIRDLKESKTFTKTLLDYKNDFDYCLLTIYYRKVTNNAGYISEVLNHCESSNASELLSNIATYIFDIQVNDGDISERRTAMNEAARLNANITRGAEDLLYDKLRTMSFSEAGGKNTAIRLLTYLTDSERRLAIELYNKGAITDTDLKVIYPDLYHYLERFSLQLPDSEKWLSGYIDEYRRSKIKDDVCEAKGLISKINASALSFQKWYANFQTVKTILHERSDIDLFYWIDGLGIDWIPFITNIVKECEAEHMYLNEVYLACSELPTTTNINKSKLKELAIDEDRLQKIGDLDSFAHTNKEYPQYIVEELNMVRQAIKTALSKYSGKKIAFVSDHGVTYLAQYGIGLNLVGVESNHEGRVATRDNGKTINDNKYIVCDDGKTMCSLTYDSLTAKTPRGHGAHGGATPEEALAPIIIVSNQPNLSNYNVEILDRKISSLDPKARFRIRGLNSIDTPTIEYNNAICSLTRESDEIFVSERLCLVDTATKITLHIGDFNRTFNIETSTGVQEDDLFGDL
ncbi:MAG: BREX-4 system phosphatase PglZ [Clostridia bacterium]|nr:BREX-4 system phosphatase PglZ [Clostridia bacterium]